MIQQLGQLLAMVFNFMRGGKGRHAKASDFVPGRQPKRKQTACEQFAVFNAFATAHNRAMKRKRETGK